MYENFSSLAITVWELGFFEDMEDGDDQFTELMNDLMTKLFLEQPLALHGSAKNLFLSGMI